METVVKSMEAIEVRSEKRADSRSSTKEAKVQVEFDSTRVLRYRPLGFENRDVAGRGFRNDKVDAGAAATRSPPCTR